MGKIPPKGMPGAKKMNWRSVDLGNKTFQEHFMRKKHYYKGRIILDVSRSDGRYTLFAMKAWKSEKEICLISLVEAAQCFTLIDEEDDFSHVHKLLEDNKCAPDKVRLINSVSEVDTQVDVIINDCASYWSGFSGWRLLEAIEAREKCLVDGGLIVPDEHLIYLRGIGETSAVATELMTRWSLPFPVDLSFLGSLAPLEVPSTCIRSKKGMTNKCLLRQFNLHTLPESATKAFSAPFFIFSRQDSSVHGFFMHLEALFSCSPPSAPKKRRSKGNDCLGEHRVFSMPFPIEVKKNDCIRGVFSMKMEDTDGTCHKWKTTIEVKHPIKETFEYQLYDFAIAPRG